MNTRPESSGIQPISHQHELARVVRAWTPNAGIQDSAIDGVKLIRADSPSSCVFTVCEPSLGFVVQGSKSVRLGDRDIVYGPLSYGVNAVHLPVLGWVVDATPERPYLAVKLTVDPQEVTDVVLDLGARLKEHDQAQACPEAGCGLCLAPMEESMQQALLRLLSLLDNPEEIPVLAPMARREIIYRTLVGEMGPRMRRFAVADSQAHRISRAITILKDRFAQPLRIRELADEINMSESSLFHTFKQVTRMSPLQFQKKLRLHEARRLMLAEGLEAATASFRVGYESPSHFSREYSRMFGAPPRADVNRLRGEPADVSA